ncbi:MAG: 3-phosphoshikimate 1-carboxyvinyltransferase [Planctomycetes bacterium]|nr:3-phosphoshikimate 1-carboxyvinyltransferase [Planctomycetota bacterium]
MTCYRCPCACGPLAADVILPGSKSLTNRALLCAALADGTSVLRDILLADDTRLMIGCLRALGIGVTIDESDRVAEVTGCRGHLPAEEATLFCGNSGTTLRFCTALAALGHGRFALDGVPRMRQRPVLELAEALGSLGAGIEYPGAPGFAPLVVHAQGLSGGEVCMDSPASSQLPSALLLAAPYAARDVFLHARNVPSAPYLRLTTWVMAQFGAAVIEQYGEPPTPAPGEAPAALSHEARFVVPAPQRYQATVLAVEPDASNAGYFLAAPALAGGRVTVRGLGTQSPQGDCGFVGVLERMGCEVARSPSSLTVAGPRSGTKLRGLEVDLNDMPDMVPTLAVLALFADGPTTIRNVANLRVKETDRIAALARELRKLGAAVEEGADGLIIHPPAKPHAASIDTYDDHRMAMSFALAGLGCEGLLLDGAECCAKTFPDFFERWELMLRGSV